MFDDWECDSRTGTSGGLCVAVLAYEASETISGVLSNVESVLHGELHRTASVLVADDHSTDGTVDEALRWADSPAAIDVAVRCNPCNLGYGGNQKAVIDWVVAHGFEYLVLMHGDAQHDPSEIPKLLAPVLADEADAVFGARTLEPGHARSGGMPLNRYLGNRGLTWVQNRLARVRFSEWHSGFRAYRVSTLRAVDTQRLPDGFEFDCAMTLALLDQGARLAEVACTTRYGDEVSRVRVIPYGLRVLGLHARHRYAAHVGSRRFARPSGRAAGSTPQLSKHRPHEAGLTRS